MAVRAGALSAGERKEARNVLAIGVDTHKASLAACAIDEVGRPLSERSFANSPEGHEEFLHWVAGLPTPHRIGLEGAAGYGQGLAQRLVAAGEDAREVPGVLTHRERRRTGRPGKCDRADALAVARIVAREERLPVALDSAMHRDLKLLVDYREQLLCEQTRVRNRLHADLHALLPGYAVHLGGPLTTRTRVRIIRELLAPLEGVAAEVASCRLLRLEETMTEAAQVKRRITAAVAGSHRSLTSIAGVGPVLAAQLLGETGDPRRFRTRAAFAMNCGVAPIPASSGATCRHRLNRGGNRRLNRALYVVALTQVRCHPPARAYIERKRAEGHSWWEAVRCLKRHLANAIHRAMLLDLEMDALTT
jgi:transposase